MIAAEATRTVGAGTSGVGGSSGLPTSRFGHFDVDAIAVKVKTLAQTDALGAQAIMTQANIALGPIDRGVLARLTGDIDIPGIPDLPDLPGLPELPGLPGLPDLPSLPGLPNLPNPIDILKDGIERLQRAAQSAKETLENLPHAVADKIADSMRGDNARVLTDREQAAVREAFGVRVDLSRVRFVDGPGNSPIARAAFAKGNPAITIGNTVYFKPGHYSTDFAATNEGRNTLVHELTHVVQYKELGYGSFGAKYADDLVRVGGNPDELYRYDKRDTTYATETLEGQAQMVGRYAEIRNSSDPSHRQEIADLERRLDGTGIYGL